MRIRKWLTMAGLICAQGCILGCGVEGLHTANPKTVIRVDPFSKTIEFYDSKDNDILIEDLQVDPDTHVWSVKKIDLKNNASRVREANAVQIDALARETLAVGQAVRDVAEQVKEMARVVAPYIRSAPAPVTIPSPTTLPATP